MGIGRNSLSLTLAVALVACGGGGSSGGGAIGGTPTPTPSPTSSTGACSLSARQDFARDVLNEWYLFPDLLNLGANKASYATVQDYIDALVAPARAQNKDRYFTYITSIAEEDAYYASGSTAGFGVRLGYDSVNRRVFVVEAYEGAPALGQAIDRGTEILAIGTSSNNLQTVNSLMTSGGAQAVVDALGPSDAGVTRVLRIKDTSGVTREVSVTKADFELDPVSDRYGAKIIDDGGKRVGYINLRTFISTAHADLREAMGNFKAQGVTEVIVDLRYNGGGLIDTADLFGNLLGANRVGQVFSYETHRASKASYDSTQFFSSEANSISPTKIVFIGRSGTASASELLMNAFIPYLGSNLALVGTNTYGKPVGQFAFDKAQCDDRIRVVALRTENASHQGDYFDGLAPFMPNTCQANDDIFTQLGDPTEASVSTALDFLAGRSCTAISATAKSAQGPSSRQLLEPRQPSSEQRDNPGVY